MKKYLLIPIIAFTLYSCDRGISEFQTHNFVKYFGSGSLSNGFDVQEISDGYILTGFDNTTLFKKQIFVVRTDKAGNVVWQRQFGTVANEEGRVVKQSGDFFYISGITTNDITGIISSFILKLSSSGDSLGFLRIGPDDYSVIINDFFVDQSYFYVAGESYQASADYSDFFVAKYNFAGEPAWSPLTSGPAGSNQSFRKININPDGSFKVVGINSGIIGSTNSHIIFGTLNSSGQVIRIDYLPTTSNQFFADAVFSGDNIYIGYNQLVTGSYKARVVNVSLSDFTTSWSIDTGIDMEVKAIGLGSDGLITLAGEINSQIYIYQLSNSGTITLTTANSLPGNVKSLAATSDNGFVLVGNTVDYGELVQMVKTDAELFLFNP